MIANEGSVIRPRRRHRVEVPVHYNNGKTRKTYSANFSSEKYKKNATQQKVSEVVIEIPDKGSAKKRNLQKEIERLCKDNEEIAAKFHELEDLSVKKILKLKEKIGNLQNVNANVMKENETIKFQYNELKKCYEELFKEYEECKVCLRCEEFAGRLDTVLKENEELRKKNREVHEDLGMLKTVVFRLNVQLERYQEKLRKHNIPIEKYSLLHSQKSSTSQLKDEEIINILTGDHQNHRHTPISWGSVNSHTLGPLLDAYQDSLNEKDDIIDNYETELAKFTGKMKEVLEENQHLYKQLHEDESCSTKLKMQLDQLKNELKSTKEQNDILIKKCAMKQDKVEEILKVYETKVDQMKRDYQVIYDDYTKLRVENASLKEKIKSLSDCQDDFKCERQNYIPIAVHTASVNECKKWYEELKQQYEQEKLKLKETIENQQKMVNELKKSKETLEEKLHKLEKDVKKYEVKQLDLEHALNEVQLSRSACRKQLHKAMYFAKDMVAEQETLLKALNQRQIENKAVKKIGSEMALRMDSLKMQLKDVQKSAWEELATVEQKIQEQEDLIERLKEEHKGEIEKLQVVIKEQEEKLGKSRIPVSPYQLFKEKYK
ncbi:hypothetical protein ABEB36_002197 [Hypothenemus hampei]|uniref:Uncharacterized protein n=1 Tax=Hypothenemus hampei TaxID=57062 RepID=A0ABD1F4Y6_HYPHA